MSYNSESLLLSSMQFVQHVILFNCHIRHYLGRGLVGVAL